MFGVPVITSNLLGMRELIEKSLLDPSIHLFEPNIEDDLYNKILQIKKMGNWDELSNLAKSSFENYFTISRLVDDLQSQIKVGN